MGVENSSTCRSNLIGHAKVQVPTTNPAHHSFKKIRDPEQNFSLVSLLKKGEIVEGEGFSIFPYESRGSVCVCECARASVSATMSLWRLLLTAPLLPRLSQRHEYFRWRDGSERQAHITPTLTVPPPRPPDPQQPT